MRANSGGKEGLRCVEVAALLLFLPTLASSVLAAPRTALVMGRFSRRHQQPARQGNPAGLDGLSGEADFTNDRVVHQSELEVYFKRGVTDLTGGQQHPVTIRPDAIADFPIVLPI